MVDMEESDVIRYNNYCICKKGERWVVKANATDCQPLHNGSLPTVSDAERFIDEGMFRAE